MSNRRQMVGASCQMGDLYSVPLSEDIWLPNSTRIPIWGIQSCWVSQAQLLYPSPRKPCQRQCVQMHCSCTSDPQRRKKSHGENPHLRNHPWKTLGSRIYRDKTYGFLAILISFQHLLWMGEGLIYLNGDSLSGHQELLQEIISRLLFFLGLDSGNTFTAIVLQNLAKVLNYWFETTMCL